MAVAFITLLDKDDNPFAVAGRNLNSSGVIYQMFDPEVSTYHRVSAGSGDAVNILAAAGVLRAVRIFNNGTVPIFVKFHNTASTPSAGTGVVYAVGCQAGLHNPDPRISGGGRAFTTGIGMTIVTGLADASAVAVTAGAVLVEVEYHVA